MLNLIAIVLGALSIGCMALGVGLAYLELAPVTVCLGLFAASGLIGLLAVGAGIGVLFTTRSTLPLVAGMSGAIPVIVVFGSLASGMRYPAINDITTDVENPPAFEAIAKLPENAGRDMGFPEGFGEIVTRNYPEVQPLTLPTLPGETFETAVKTAKDFGWEIVRHDRRAGLIEAVSTTKLFRFRDDVVIRIAATEGGSRIDMRSKSRVGRGDLGANAKRIRSFFDAVEGHLGLLP